MKYVDRSRWLQCLLWIGVFLGLYVFVEVITIRLFANQGNFSTLRGIMMPPPRVGIVMMLHDDEDILPYWIRYHSALFGMENLLILDNYCSENIKRMLFTWNQQNGLKVLWNQGPYVAKGNLTYQAFREYFPSIDIAIPLDVDEFLVAFDGSIPKPSQQQILQELHFFWRKKIVCWGLQQYYTSLHFSLNDSIQTVHSFYPDIYTLANSKKLVRADSFVGIDHGSHNVFLSTAAPGGCIGGLNHLGLLHYHFRSPQRTIQRALNDMIGFGYLPSTATLQTLSQYKVQIQALANESIAGFHKARQLLVFLEKGIEGILNDRLGYPSDDHQIFQLPVLEEIIQKIYQ